jgi:hypothetical protein
MFPIELADKLPFYETSLKKKKEEEIQMVKIMDFMEIYFCNSILWE